MATSRATMNEAKLREVIERTKVDAVVASSLENVCYSSGAQIETQRRLRDRPVFSVIPAKGDQALVVCDLEESLARAQTWVDQEEIHIYVEFAKEPCELLAEVIEKKGLAGGRIGIERRHLHVAYYEQLKGLLPHVEFVGFDAEFDEVRALKTPEEIRRLQAAARATERAYVAAWSQSREGDVEKVVARRMMNAVLDEGAGSVRFLVIGSGENNRHTHNNPSDRILRRGDLVRCDFGAFFGAYTSDVARMATVGEAQPRHREIYHLIRDVERDAISHIRPGIRACDVYGFCKDRFEGNGLPFSMPHVGHSQLVGGGHENPMLQPYNQQPLLPSMTLYLELFYVHEGVDAFHLEDLVLVTESGARVLSDVMNTDEMFVIS